MDFEKLLKLGTDYLSDYLWDLRATLLNPTLRFQPHRRQSIVSLPSGQKVSNLRLNPKLLTFVIISIFVGSTINTLIPSRVPGQDFITTAIIVIVSWFFYGCIIHWLCGLLKGRGAFVETLSVIFQLLAVLYVTSSFTAFAWGILVSVPQLAAYFASFGWVAEMLVTDPMTMYFLVQFGLLFVYLPIAVKYIHGFKWFQQITVGVPALVVLLSLGYSAYKATGVHYLHAPDVSVIWLAFRQLLATTGGIAAIIALLRVLARGRIS